MSAEREVALFAYKVGWEPKGWLPDRPWVGVSTHLRHALFALARQQGLDVTTTRSEHGLSYQLPAEVSSHLQTWTEEDYRPLGDLHPLSPNTRLTLQRLGLAFLERVLPNAAQVKAVPDEPLRWLVQGQVVTLSEEDMLALRLPRQVQVQVKKLGGPLRAKPQAWEHWLTLAPLQLRVWAMAWLSRLEALIHAGQRELHVKLLEDNPLPLLALWDSLELLEAVRRLYTLPWSVPKVTVQLPADAPRCQEAVQAYLGESSGMPGRTPLAKVKFAPVHRCDVALGSLDLLEGADPHWPEEEVYAAGVNLQRRLDLPFQEYQVAVAEREVLDFIFARFFAHTRLRDEQYAAIRRVLEGDPLLVLLPTGYGKSVIYQMVGLMQPGVALIISPLTALIKDQIAHLRQDGIIGAGFVVGSVTQASREYTFFEEGRYRLFYCAPERFETPAFKKAVANLIERHRIALVAVDEAHCVSEWGHDFRPAYMHVKSMRKRLQQDTDHPIPLLALTATASPVVRADIQRALGIPDGNVIQSRSSDRPELSFSVHAADGRRGRQARLQVLDQVFSEVAPALFGDDLLARNPDGTYANGAVVFTPFADSREPALYGSGTSVVREHLARGVLAGDEVGMYASSAPGACPQCGSHNFYRDYGKFRCNACGHVFSKQQIGRDEDWDQTILDTQENFLASHLPVLVSTKGFGMGIDKQNIRLVTHYVMSGSLEAYYQEAGRAGRSGEHAHVALVTVPPARACAEQHIDQLTTLASGDDLPFPCLKRNAKGYASLHCPYGLQELCDVAQQALFIQWNFPSATQDLADLLKVFNALISSTNSVISPPEGVKEEDMQRALSRLATMSVVRTYVKQGRSFKVNFNREWTAAAALRELAKELRGFDQLTGAPQQTPPRLQAMLDQPGLRLADYVHGAGQLLIDTLYSSVRSMRVYSLVNLYRFTALPPGQCRRVHLRRSFEVTPLQSDYQCGFCDTCQPDLKFGREVAYTPLVLSHEEELGARFEAQLEQFDLNGATALLRECQQAGVSASLLTRSNYLLEQRPNDLGLLFMNTALHALEHQPEQAARVAMRAVQVMRRAGYAGRDIAPYLSALDAFVPDLSRALYTGMNGPFDDAAGRLLALESLGVSNPEQARELQRRWTLQAMNTQAQHITSTIKFTSTLETA
ncbi:ATP-dependent DNA helicase RecQ [Deinococcus cavernae]|uniref:ATP-dependent DNA helicase RecQ n=1 Tax=Deinococcus cavernae TaxID=2320857 RepID=A0A418VHQ7_9DEIO|nr:ATP-dependent DNA helicase RecQ [Deinococcus cavernae]